MAKNPLHDNSRSSGDEKPKEEKKPEAKKPESAAEEKPAAEAAAEKPAGEAEAPAAEAGPAEAGPKDKFLDGMKAIRKRHETEHRDFHGNNREAMRQMSTRHGKEIADHFDLHFSEGGTAAEGTAGSEKPAKPAAEA